MSSPPPAAGRGPFGLPRDFALLLVAITAMEIAAAMVSVALGWQVYAIHRSAFDLGLIGLVQFVPAVLLALPAGHVADRLSRRLLFACSLALSAAVALALLVATLEASSRLGVFLALAFGAGVAVGVGAPAARALGPTLIPLESMARGMALRSSAISAGIVVGPALGGLLFALQPALVYAVVVALLLASLAATLALHEAGGAAPAAPPAAAPPPAARPREGPLAGVRFIGQTPILFGAISLDLFAVLFGGAVALLPAFARSILHVGPIGLGLLRSAPAVGALAAGLLLTLRPLRGRAGPTLLVAVGGFGACTIVFGLSRSFALSLAALALGGAFDMVSMNIRATIAALAAPDELRGRAVAVELVFLSASNELGAFESGSAAALLGTAPSVVAGGVVTVAIALLWPRLFPALARVDRIGELTGGAPAPGPERAG